jgi:putative mRNA 3-end processing factor
VAEDLVITTDRGLFCPLGNFHIDPWLPVDLAVTTHGHTDHLRPGSARYLTTPTGRVVLAHRLGPSHAGRVDALAYGRPLRVGDVTVSLHPAGHVLGSAQVRIERATGARAGETWVISGDYKTDRDGVSEPFEPVRCDTFITESTFGLPIYRWPAQEAVFGQINAWWAGNAREGRLGMIACYALGKAQRLMAGLDASIGPILIHGALKGCTEAYREAGVALPATAPATQEAVRASAGRAIVLAPPSAVRSEWAFKLPGKDLDLTSAMASGWMSIRGTRRRRVLDRGFALSDHADWAGLLGAIEATGASRVGVTHGAIGTMVRFLRERGLDAFAVPTRFEGESAEEAPVAEPGMTPEGIEPSSRP